MGQRIKPGTFELTARAITLWILLVFTVWSMTAIATRVFAQKEVFANNAVSTLAAAIAAGDTSLTVATGEGARFPAISGGDWFNVVLEDGPPVTKREFVKVTARSGDVLTIVRAQQGSTAQAFSIGDKVEQRLSAATLTQLQIDSTLGNANPSNVTANAADTYITGSNVNLAGRIRQGTLLRWVINATKTAAGLATPVFSVRFGTAATTADAARCALTGTAQTAVADTAWVEINVSMRAVGSGTTGVAQCGLGFNHIATTTGFQTRQFGVIQATSSGFDTTTSPLNVGVSVNPGASGVWTIQQVNVLATNILQ
jgi:hypothetical protein